MMLCSTSVRKVNPEPASLHLTHHLPVSSPFTLLAACLVPRDIAKKRDKKSLRLAPCSRWPLYVFPASSQYGLNLAAHIGSLLGRKKKSYISRNSATGMYCMDGDVSCIENDNVGNLPAIRD